MPHTYIIPNIGLLVRECFAAAALAFGVAVGGAYAGLSPLGAAAAAGTVALVMNALLAAHTGAMLTPGGAIMHALCWIFRVMPRRYYFPAALASGDEDWTPAALAIGDVVAGALYGGAQIGGALLGVLALDAVDRSGLLAASVHTAPFGNLAGHTWRALLAAYLLNTLVLLACAGLKAGAGWRSARLTAPLALGAAVGGAVLASYVLGVGSALSFATDLALAVVVTHHYSRLWISAVAQLAAALTAAATAYLLAQSDRLAAAYGACDEEYMADSDDHHHDRL